MCLDAEGWSKSKQYFQHKRLCSSFNKISIAIANIVNIGKTECMAFSNGDSDADAEQKGVSVKIVLSPRLVSRMIC